MDTLIRVLMILIGIMMVSYYPLSAFMRFRKEPNSDNFALRKMQMYFKVIAVALIFITFIFYILK